MQLEPNNETEVIGLITGGRIDLEQAHESGGEMRAPLYIMGLSGGQQAEFEVNDATFEHILGFTPAEAYQKILEHLSEEKKGRPEPDRRLMQWVDGKAYTFRVANENGAFVLVGLCSAAISPQVPQKSAASPPKPDTKEPKQTKKEEKAKPDPKPTDASALSWADDTPQSNDGTQQEESPPKPAGSASGCINCGKPPLGVKKYCSAKCRRILKEKKLI